jgi:hypothetical protein
MDKKRILKKLISLIPGYLQSWDFKAWNEGSANHKSYYGLICDEPGIIPGINIESWSDWRKASRHDVVFNERKMSNVIAAYVAIADPAFVAELIEENERLSTLLKQVPQWSRGDNYGSECILCGEHWPGPHERDCYFANEWEV